MSADRRSRSLSPLQSAVANLLRAARSELDDARLVFRRGHRRNAAVLAAQALAHIVESLAASEHGWPLVEWNAGLGAIPEANPFQLELADIDVAVTRVTRPAVRADGEAAPAPGASELAGLLQRIAAMLKAVAQVFEADLDGTGPAGNVRVIREEVPLKPPESEPYRSSPAPSPTAARKRQRELKALPASREAPTDTRSAARPRKSAVVRATPPGRRRSPGRKTAMRSAVSSPDPGAAPKPSPSSAEPAAAALAEQETQPPERLSPAHRAPDVTSTVFWSLMDRWRLGDLEALDLIGHPGGLTKKGTRPRFRVVGKEAELFHYLQEIDAALKPLDIEPAEWMRKPIGEAPFGGASPLAHISQSGVGGARDVMHRILAMSLLPAATGARRPGAAS